MALFRAKWNIQLDGNSQGQSQDVETPFASQVNELTATLEGFNRKNTPKINIENYLYVDVQLPSAYFKSPYKELKKICANFVLLEDIMDLIVPASRRGNSNPSYKSNREFVKRQIGESDTNMYQHILSATCLGTLKERMGGNTDTFKLNLNDLNRKIIQFRQHGGTYNVEKSAKWLHFLVSFVSNSEPAFTPEFLRQQYSAQRKFDTLFEYVVKRPDLKQYYFHRFKELNPRQAHIITLHSGLPTNATGNATENATGNATENATGNTRDLPLQYEGAQYSIPLVDNSSQMKPLGTSTMANGNQHYFAFGSNMSVAQMNQRGTIYGTMVPAALLDHKLAFNKRSKDGVQSYANIVQVEKNSGNVVYGILYMDCPPETFRQLDQYEGVRGGHYKRELVQVVVPVESLTRAQSQKDPKRPRRSANVGSEFQGWRQSGIQAKGNHDVVLAVTYVAGSNFICNDLLPRRGYLKKLLDGKGWLPESYFRELSKTRTQNGFF